METLRDLLSPWADWPEALTRVLREKQSVPDRALELAEQLHRRAPLAHFASCRLDDVEKSSGSPSESAERLVAPLNCGECDCGHVEFGLPADTSVDVRAALSAILALAAHGLAARLEVEALREERAEAADLVTVGEAMAGLTHAINNSLNTMMLQTATVQLRVSPELRDSLALIRREGAQAAARLRPLQQIRQQRQPNAAGDLNAAVRAALAASPDLARRFALDIAKDLPAIAASPAQLRRLMALLLRSAVACQPDTEGPWRLRTLREGPAVRLVVEVPGTFEGEAPARLSEVPLGLGGIEEVERIAVETMVKRLGGHLALSKREEGGLTIRLGWPARAGA